MTLEDHGLNNAIFDPEFVLSKSNAMIQFHGSENMIVVGRDCIVQNLMLVFYGLGHKLTIEDGVHLYWGRIVFQGDRNLLTIGEGTEVREYFNFNALEHDHHVSLGKRCLVSNTVHIRNYDSHPIFDAATGEKINEGRDVTIGDRVWICENVHILKGTKIGPDSVVGAGSVVTGGEFPPNSVIAGNPAKVVRTGVRWEV